MLHQRSEMELIEEQVGIGQAARFIQTPHGNVLWDLVAYLDEDTIRKVEELGGLKMIVISHPHFYTYFQPPKESNSKLTTFSEHGQTGPQPSSAPSMSPPLIQNG